MVIARQLKIYVLHGDAVVARTVADFLGDLEYEAVPLHAAEDLEASLEAENPQTPVAVVVELETLGTDPVGRLRRIQVGRPNVAFLLMDDGGCAVSETGAGGVRAFLRQPLRLAELELALASLCGDAHPTLLG